MPLTSGLPVSRLVSVEVVLTTPGVVAPAINSLLLLGTSTADTTPSAIDTVERARLYGSITEVGDDFPVTSEEFLAAELWFAQAPSPDNLLIGRWVKTASHGTLVGAFVDPSEQLMQLWTGITNGGFTVTFDGGAAHPVTGLSFATQTTLNGVAAAITTALAGAGTMTWDAARDRFRLRSTSTGPTSSVSFLTAPATGTDLGPLLKMQSTSSGAYVAGGLAAESPVTALIAIDDKFSGKFYGVVCPSASAVQQPNLAVYCEAADPPHYLGVTTQDVGTLDATSTGDLASTLKAGGYDRTAIQYSSSSPYAIMSYMARILTTQWGGSNTAITLMYKQEPGVTAENLSSQQATTLGAKNCNVYVTYANGAEIIEYGQSCSGEFTDTVIGADALAGDIQTDLFNVMYTTPTKIPQTDPGQAVLKNTAKARCQAYVANGWLAPGTWEAQGFGTLNFGDLLPLGYYVWMPSILTQPEADRAARKSNLMQIAAKCAGAIQTVDVVIFVNQ